MSIYGWLKLNRWDGQFSVDFETAQAAMKLLSDTREAFKQNGWVSGSVSEGQSFCIMGGLTHQAFHVATENPRVNRGNARDYLLEEDPAELKLATLLFAKGLGKTDARYGLNNVVECAVAYNDTGGNAKEKPLMDRLDRAIEDCHTLVGELHPAKQQKKQLEFTA